MNIQTKQGVKGRFTLSVMGSNGKEKAKVECDNMVLDALISNLNADSYKGAQFPGANILYKVALGTGTTPPQPGDNTLESQVVESSFSGGLNTSYSEIIPGETLKGVMRRAHSFNQGQINANLSEIGVIDSRGDLITRSLIKDDLGNPTTLTVTNQEQLILTYYLEFVDLPLKTTGSVNITDKTGAVIDTVTYEVRICGSKFTSHNNEDSPIQFGINSKQRWLSYEDTYLSNKPKPADSDWGYGINVSSATGGVKNMPSAISPQGTGDGLKKRFKWGIGDANVVGGITRIVTFYRRNDYPGMAVIHFDKPINKTSSDVLEIESEVIWSRA